LEPRNYNGVPTGPPRYCPNSSAIKSNSPAPSASKATEDGQTRFLRLVGLTNYIEKLKAPEPYPPRVTEVPCPEEAILSGSVTKLSRQGATREFGWLWTPKDAWVRELSIEEVRKKCETPDKESENKWAAAWAHAGYVSKDGKILSQIIIYPYLTERDEILKPVSDKGQK
jgi:hypothetical protein